jgi:hypothetical protein
MVSLYTLQGKGDKTEQKLQTTVREATSAALIVLRQIVTCQETDINL